MPGIRKGQPLVCEICMHSDVEPETVTRPFGQKRQAKRCLRVAEVGRIVEFIAPVYSEIPERPLSLDVPIEGCPTYCRLQETLIGCVAKACTNVNISD